MSFGKSFKSTSTVLSLILILGQVVLPQSQARAQQAWAPTPLAVNLLDSDDLDVERAERIAREAQAAEQSAREALGRAETREREIRERRDQAVSQLSRTRTELRQSRDRVQALRSDIPNLRTRITQLKSTLEELNGRLAGLQTSARDKRAEASRLDATARDLEAKAEKARKEGAPNAPELARRAEQARRLATIADGDADRAESDLRALQGDIRKNQTELQQKESALASATTELNQLAQTQIPALEREETRLEQSIDPLNRQLADAARDLDVARRVHEQARERSESADRRLAEVRRNLEQAIAQARSQGAQDGARQGGIEGARNGASEGGREGIEQGVRDGRRDGMSEGIERARRRGSVDGQNAGQSLGASQGYRDGSFEGRRDGDQVGEREGLQSGFQDGLADGDRAGYIAGRDQGLQDGGYQKGLNAGRLQGDAQARADGDRQGYPEGYASMEEELRAGPLAESSTRVALNGSGAVSGGAESTVSPSRVRFNASSPRLKQTADGRSALSPNHPHPAVRDAYERSYREAYQDAYRRNYEREYRESYAQARDRAYQREYAEWVSRDYPGEYREAYDRASAIAYQQAYRQEYDLSYARTYRPAYDDAFRRAYPVRRQEGYDRGNAEGFARGRKEAFDQDYSRGYSEGHAAAYRTALPGYLAAARERGRAAARARYQESAVLEVESLSLSDLNQDGVFAAGESIELISVIANFGFAATVGSGKQAIRVELAPLTEGLELQQGSVTAIEHAARTRTTSRSLAPSSGLRVRSSVRTGALERVQVRLYHGDGLLQERVLELRVGEVFSGVSLVFDAPVSDGIWNQARVTLKNRSLKAASQAVDYRFSSADSRVELEGATGRISSLAAGEQKDITFKLRFPAELAFQKLQLQGVFQAGSNQRGASSFAFDTTRRWSYNPAADGLIVLRNRKEGLSVESALRASGRAIDYWNIEAEGALSGEQARLYAGKLLVVGDASALTESATRDALYALVQNGTRLLDLGDGKDSAGGTSLADLIEADSQGYPLRARAGALEIQESNPFMNPDRVVRSWMRLNGDAGAAIRQAWLISQPLVIQLAHVSPGADPAASEDASLALKHSLIAEMRGVNHANGDQFKKGHPELSGLKVSQYVGSVLGAQGADQERLLALYPDLLEARKSLGGWFDRHRLQLKRILKPVARLAD